MANSPTTKGATEQHLVDNGETAILPRMDDRPTSRQQMANGEPALQPLRTDETSYAHAPNFSDDEDESLLSDTEPMLGQTAGSYLKGTTHIRGPNTLCRTLFLTLCLAGLQFTWAVEMAYGTPYLLSLGLTKSFMSLVWIAGPLSGLLMQPIVGALSDRCTSSFGRRRPFLVLGSIAVVICLLVIGWTREITSLLTGTQEGDTFKHLSIGIAIASIYFLDFSINCVQASCRALLVDALPPSQQEDGTAWASRMVGLGNVAGYFMGYADLVTAFPFLGNTQLKVLCVIASGILLLCDAITCYTVSEKVLTKENSEKPRESPFAAFSAIASNIWNLPRPIRRICNVQFFAWIGWFPFLFYSTTWVAEIYDQTALQNPGQDTDDAVGQATRAGSFSFLIYSLVSLGASFLLPLIVAPSYGKENTNRTFRIRWRGRDAEIEPSKYLKIPFLTLPRAWCASHFLFCIMMLSTVFVSDVAGASVVIGICGVSWAMTMWAPFSLLGEYISQNEQLSLEQRHNNQREQDGHEEQNVVFSNPRAMSSSRFSLAAGGASLGTEGGFYQLVEQPEDANNRIEMHGRQDLSTHNAVEAVNHDPSATSAGILLGIHNMYIVLPQFLVTFFSSIMFHFLEKGNTEGEAASPGAIGVVLRFGAIMAGIAGYFTTRIGRAPT
ncbi:major facilitator superfamily domain-containing protein [Syncephalastrum racemosum]|uniref:Major facilitator superfamily domain-containing protein n=1 Tax=Syncephalastrum racemosum TaxID=13706 RepID=A0A1X2HV63_SYNRA|nr:major facilitator superfamily domain-containing protein [Syncephalastrum racemosum]